MPAMQDDIEDVVIRCLEEITKIPRERIRLSDQLVHDLRADGDDLSFLFVPGVERAIGVKVDPLVWRRVITVKDAVEALRAARQSLVSGFDRNS